MADSWKAPASIIAIAGVVVSAAVGLVPLLPSTEIPGHGTAAAPTSQPAPSAPTEVLTKPSDSASAPSPVQYQWSERWSDAIQVEFAEGIDFDYLPPPGRLGFGTDLKTSAGYTDLATERTGKLVRWTDTRRPTPQSCYDLVSGSPTGQDSQYVNHPKSGEWFCLLTANGSSPGRIVTFRVTETTQSGINIEAKVWDRHAA